VEVRATEKLLQRGSILSVALIDRIGFAFAVVISPFICVYYSHQEQTTTVILKEIAFAALLLLAVVEIHSAYLVAKEECQRQSKCQGPDN
jgi:hypothetical protein